MKPPAPTLTFDPETYAHHIDGLDLTEDQRDELILAIANIMIAYVDLGFGVSPAQTPCGQDGFWGGLIPKTAPDLLYCGHSETPVKAAPSDDFPSAEREES